MIYFIFYLFLEIMISYEFANLFSPFGLFLEILATFFIGLMLIRTLNFSLVESMQKLSKKEISQEEFISIGMFKFIGAILLMLPGVFTDILGVLMQFDFIGILVAKKLIPKQEFKNFDDINENDIIDVDIVEELK